jgi:hypothetical protein
VHLVPGGRSRARGGRKNDSFLEVSHGYEVSRWYLIVSCCSCCAGAGGGHCSLLAAGKKKKKLSCEGA